MTEQQSELQSPTPIDTLGWALVRAERERDELRAASLHVSGRTWPEIVSEMQVKLDALKVDRRNQRIEIAQCRADADHYRTAIENWHDLSCQKNINGPDGPTDEWKRAVDVLKAIATGESHD